MEKEITVTITRKGDEIKVMNSLGKVWSLKFKENLDIDMSTASLTGFVAQSFLTSTLASQIYHVHKSKIEFTLKVKLD